jgi:hypothetical protein
VGSDLQATRRCNTAKHHCQLRTALAQPSAKLVFPGRSRCSDRRCRTFLSSSLWKRRNAGNRGCHLDSFLSPDRRQGEYSSICPCPHPIPVSKHFPITPALALTHDESFIRNSCAQKLGFSNAELLQDTDWDKVKLDPRRAAPKLPKWVWGHDPEAYAYENYEKSAQSLKEGVDMKDEDKFEPNYPKGYKYEPWSIEKVMEDMRAGKPIDLGAGDWE